MPAGYDRDREGQRQHALLGRAGPQPRGQRCCRASNRAPTPPPRSANQNVPADTRAEPEGEVEEEEADAGPQERHRQRRGADARRRAAACARPAPRPSPRRRRRGRRRALRKPIVNISRRVDQRRPAGQRVDQLQHGRREHGDEAGQAGDHAELGVGLDEIGLGAHDRRHDRRLRHQVRLLQDERGEHEREQGEAVDRQRHPQRDHDPAQGDELDDEAPPTGGPVDRRPDQRRRARRTGRS